MFQLNLKEAINRVQPHHRQALVDRLREERNNLTLPSMPSNSAYIAHRLTVIDRAIEILTPPPQSSQPAPSMDELSSLLESLSMKP